MTYILIESGDRLLQEDGFAFLLDHAGADPVSFTLTGPATIVRNTPATYTITLNAPATAPILFPITLTGVAGAVSPATPAIPATASSVTFAVTASVAGDGHIEVANDFDLTWAGPKAITVIKQSYAFSGPTTGTAYAIIGPITVTGTGTLASPAVLTLTDGGAGGGFLIGGSPVTTATLPAGTNTSVQIYYQAGAAGTININASNAADLTAAGPLAIVVSPEQPIYTDLSGAPTEQIATLQTEPDGNSILPRSLDPGTREPITVDVATAFPTGTTIGTCEWAGFDDADAADGMRLGTGALRLAIDRDHKLIRIYPYCDPAFQQLAAYAGAGKVVRPRVRLTRVAVVDLTNPLNEAVEFSVPHLRKQR